MRSTAVFIFAAAIVAAASLRHAGLRGADAREARGSTETEQCDVPESERVLSVAMGSIANLKDASLTQWEEAARALASAPVKKSAGKLSIELPCRAVFTRQAFYNLAKSSSEEAHDVILASWLGGGFVDAKGAGGQAAAERPKLLTGPFVAKKRLPLASYVAFFGDLHGELTALVTELRMLRKTNLLSEDLVLRGNVLLVFCGDLVDRGPAPFEVLALTLALRLRNPTNVLLVRGNHEHLGMWNKYGAIQAADAKWGVADALGVADMQKEGEKASSAIMTPLSAALNTFPVAAFITVGARPDAKWAMAMHGAFEPSVNVAGFLAANSLDGFAAIGAPGSGVSAMRYDDWAHAYFSGSDAPPQPTNPFKQMRPLDTDTAPTWARLADANGPPLGFQWGDFFSSFDKPTTVNDVLSFRDNRGYKFTQQLTKEWMKANDIAAIFRGHQHDTPWLLQLNDHSGFVDPWKDGLVTSIISFATLYDDIVENVYTEMKKKRANFPPYRPTPAAFALAKLVEDPAQWQITYCIANAGADVAEKPCHKNGDWRAGTGLESVDAKRVAAFTQFRQPAPTANGAVDFDTSAQPPSLLQQQPLLLQQLNEALVGAPEKGRESPPVNLITHNENGMPKLIDPSSQHAGSRDSVRRDSGGGGMEPHSAKADAATTLGDLVSGLCAFPENSARKVPAPPSAVCEVVAFAENAFKSDQNPAIFYTWTSGRGAQRRHIALVRVPTTIADLPRPTKTFLLRWFEPATAVAGGKKGDGKAATPVEAASSRSAPLALNLLGADLDVNYVVSPCAKFKALHRARAVALKKSSKEAGAKKAGSAIKADAHNDMVKRASDSCGAADEATYPGSSNPQRCLCVALETLPSGNNAPENRVMRILVPDGVAGDTFSADIERAAVDARSEDRHVRDLLELARRGADFKRRADNDKRKAGGQDNGIPLSSVMLFDIKK